MYFCICQIINVKNVSEFNGIFIFLGEQFYDLYNFIKICNVKVLYFKITVVIVE